MRPPICDICNQRFSPAKGGGLIQFALTEQDQAFNERFVAARMVGHKRGAKWCCADHYPAASRHTTFTWSAYRALLRGNGYLVHPYSPSWATAFLRIAKVLRAAIAVEPLTIHHVGSTAVPGLSAKPVIDLDVELPQEMTLPQIVDRLAKVGYTHNGNQGVPQREAFRRKARKEDHPILDTIPHHLYVCPPDSPELARHLRFRDALRQHAWAREAYGQLKLEIAEKAGQDRKAYAALKETAARELVERILLAD